MIYLLLIFMMLLILIIVFAFVLVQRPVNTFHPTKYVIDGEFSDWSNKQLVINEVGGVGCNDSASNIDLKQLYLDNDNSFLYLFVKCDPGLTTHFKKHQTSGILAYLYLDHDQNEATGSDNIDHSGNEAMLGTETRIWIPLSVSISFPSQKTSCSISYDISNWNSGIGEFDSDSFSADSDFCNSELISYTDEGVEMAIHLKELNLSPSDKFNLICCEWANNTPDDANHKEITLQK